MSRPLLAGRLERLMRVGVVVVVVAVVVAVAAAAAAAAAAAVLVVGALKIGAHAAMLPKVI